MQNKTIYLLAGGILALFVVVGIAVVANFGADNNGVTLASGAQDDSSADLPDRSGGSEIDPGVTAEGSAPSAGDIDDVTKCLSDRGLDIDALGDEPLDLSDLNIEMGGGQISIEINGQQLDFESIAACLTDVIDFGELNFDDPNLDLPLDDLGLDDLGLEDLNLDDLNFEELDLGDLQSCLDAMMNMMDAGAGSDPSELLDSIPDECREALGL